MGLKPSITMRLKLVLNISYFVATLGIASGKLPTFTWDLSGNKQKAVRLTIDFNDNRPKDVALLSRQDIPYAVKDQDETNECIFSGQLQHDSRVTVTVGGCPGSTTFGVMINSKRLDGDTYIIEKGVVSMLDPTEIDPNVPDIFVQNNIEPRSQDEMREAEIYQIPLPNEIRIVVALRYDNIFLNQVCRRDHDMAEKRAFQIAKLAESHFFQKMSQDYLGTTITLDLTTNKIEHRNVNLTIRKDNTCKQDGFNLPILCSLGQAMKLSAEESGDADNFHYLSGDKRDGTYGVAASYNLGKASGYNTGDFKGQGSACMPKELKSWKTALTEVPLGQTDGSIPWTKQKFLTAKRFSHELGHALGMMHDFVGDFNWAAQKGRPLFDSDRKSCLGTGVMGYQKKYATWSTCSKDQINAWFFLLSAKGYKCLGGTHTQCRDECASRSSNCHILAWGYHGPLMEFTCSDIERDLYGGCLAYGHKCKKTCGWC